MWVESVLRTLEYPLVVPRSALLSALQGEIVIVGGGGGPLVTIILAQALDTLSSPLQVLALRSVRIGVLKVMDSQIVYVPALRKVNS